MEKNNPIEVDSKNPDKADPKKPRRRRFLRILGLVLIVAGIAVIGYPASTFLVTNNAQSELRSDWDKIVQEAAKNVAPNPPATSEETQTPAENEKKPSKGKSIPAGKAAFKMLIPKIGLDRIVVKGTDRASLKLGPGHMTKTVFPGEPGVCLISGHRTTYGAPFFRLDRLGKGDQIIIETVASTFVYIVYDVKTVTPNDTSFIVKTDNSIIAITTCTPIHSARKRLIVLAELRN